MRQVYRGIGVVNPTHKASSRNILFDYDEKDTPRHFQLSCAHVDFDGKRIGPVSTTFVIRTSVGERSVESLELRSLPCSTSSSEGFFYFSKTIMPFSSISGWAVEITGRQIHETARIAT